MKRLELEKAAEEARQEALEQQRLREAEEKVQREKDLIEAAVSDPAITKKILERSAELAADLGIFCYCVSVRPY